MQVLAEALRTDALFVLVVLGRVGPNIGICRKCVCMRQSCTCPNADFMIRGFLELWQPKGLAVYVLVWTRIQPELIDVGVFHSSLHFLGPKARMPQVGSSPINITLTDRRMFRQICRQQGEQSFGRELLEDGCWKARSPCALPQLVNFNFS